MTELIDTKQYYLSTSNSVITENLNFPLNSKIRYYINNIIDKSPVVLYTSVKLSHAELPYSFYIINEYNNQFIINSQTIEVPFGNYNAIDLLNILNTLLSQNGITASFTFNTSNGKYSITSSSPFTIQSATIYGVIGLDKNTNYNGIFNGVTQLYQITFPYLVNTGGSKNIYVESNFITDNFQTLSNKNGILKSIPINVPPYGIIMYNNNENLETIVKNRDLPYLEISLLDDDGNLIDFNGLDWNICLEIKTTKKYFANTINLINDQIIQSTEENKK